MSHVPMDWTDMTGDIDLEDGFKAPDYSVVRRRLLHASQILMVERPRATW